MAIKKKQNSGQIVFRKNQNIGAVDALEDATVLKACFYRYRRFGNP